MRRMGGSATSQVAGLGIRHGGVMRTGRAIIVSAVLALGAAGSILASAAVSTAAVHTTSAHVQPAASFSSSRVHYNG